MATEQRLIKVTDATAVCNGIALYVAENAYLNDTALDVLTMVAKWLDDAPTIEARPVVHGRWVNPYMNRYGHPCHCCSICGFKASYQDKNYCPNCGAQMDGGADNG